MTEKFLNEKLQQDSDQLLNNTQTKFNYKIN